MGRQGMSKPHSIRYIRQMMEWGFDKEFIAKDCGISVSASSSVSAADAATLVTAAESNAAAENL